MSSFGEEIDYISQPNGTAPPLPLAIGARGHGAVGEQAHRVATAPGTEGFYAAVAGDPGQSFVYFDHFS